MHKKLKPSGVWLLNQTVPTGPFCLDAKGNRYEYCDVDFDVSPLVLKKDRSVVIEYKRVPETRDLEILTINIQTGTVRCREYKSNGEFVCGNSDRHVDFFSQPQNQYFGLMHPNAGKSQFKETSND